MPFVDNRETNMRNFLTSTVFGSKHLNLKDSPS